MKTRRVYLGKEAFKRGGEKAKRRVREQNRFPIAHPKKKKRVVARSHRQLQEVVAWRNKQW